MKALAETGKFGLVPSRLPEEILLPLPDGTQASSLESGTHLIKHAIRRNGFHAPFGNLAVSPPGRRHPLITHVRLRRTIQVCDQRAEQLGLFPRRSASGSSPRFPLRQWPSFSLIIRLYA